MITEVAFAQEVRGFLAAHAQRKDQPGDDEELLESEAVARTKAFQRALFDAGLAGLTFPVEYGGRGLSRTYQEIFTREASQFTLPTRAITISHGMCLPILNDFGTP
ncbi:MAG TPA: acyl-CoA dehydrogenase family protein [Acidimicrobiales bacterium]|nr:acyl-CoA dehydrogenase family protein [Acidimicrobiales bacterium]